MLKQPHTKPKPRKSAKSAQKTAAVPGKRTQKRVLSKNRIHQKTAEMDARVQSAPDRSNIFSDRVKNSAPTIPDNSILMGPSPVVGLNTIGKKPRVTGLPTDRLSGKKGRVTEVAPESAALVEEAKSEETMVAKAPVNEPPAVQPSPLPVAPPVAEETKAKEEGLENQQAMEEMSVPVAPAPPVESNPVAETVAEEPAPVVVANAGGEVKSQAEPEAQPEKEPEPESERVKAESLAPSARNTKASESAAKPPQAKDPKPKTKAESKAEPGSESKANAESEGEGLVNPLDEAGGFEAAEIPEPELDTSQGSSVVKSLAALPPTQRVLGMKKVPGGLGEAQNKEVVTAQNELPVVDRPTGLGRDDFEAPKTEKPDLLPPPSLDLGGKGGGEPIDTTHPDPQVPTPGSDIHDVKSEEVNSPGLFASFLAQLPGSDPNVDTSAGPRPGVDTTGDADPHQNAEMQSETDLEMQENQYEADTKVYQDFGENDMYPTVEPELLSTDYQMGEPTAYTGGEIGELPKLSGQMVEGLDPTLDTHYQADFDSELVKTEDAQSEYETESENEREKGLAQIEAETEKTKGDQKTAQDEGRAKIESQRSEWREENEAVKQEYKDQSTTKKAEIDKQIDDKIAEADEQVETKFAEAEKEAEDAKKVKEAEADKKRREAEEKRKKRSWWQKIGDAIGDFFNWLKDAIVKIFDALRSIVKGIIELAKKAVNFIIDLARDAIVGFIKAFAEVLKGLVKIALFAFPELAEKFTKLIDDAVEATIKVIDILADGLKDAINAYLDLIGAAIDLLLDALQAVILAVVAVYEFLILGILKLLEGIANLVMALGEMPDQFFGQVTEEMLGFDAAESLDQEYPSYEETGLQPGMQTLQLNSSFGGGSGMESGGAGAGPESAGSDPGSFFDRGLSGYSENDFAVDPVLSNPQFDPEFQAYIASLPEGEYEFGEQNDADHGIESLMRDFTGAGMEQGPGGGEAVAQSGAEGGAMEPASLNDPVMQSYLDPARDIHTPDSFQMVGPFTQLQRAGFKAAEMGVAIKQWFMDNWPIILAVVVAGIVGMIAANILTGGAVMAALPLLMQIVGAFFAAVAIGKMTVYMGKYIGAAWPGELRLGGKHFARALAIGAIELLFFFLFGGKAALKGLKEGIKTTLKTGVKGLAKSGVKLAKTGVQNTLKSVKGLGTVAKEGFRNTIKNGKLVFQGMRKGAMKGAKSLDDLGKRLGKFFRFEGFKIVIKGRRWMLMGKMNPWVLVATGENRVEVRKVSKAEVGSAKVGDDILIDGKEGIYLGKNRPKLTTTQSQELVDAGFDARHIAALSEIDEGIEVALAMRHLDSPENIMYILRQADELGIKDQIVRMIKSRGIENPQQLREMLSELPGKRGNYHELNIADDITGSGKRAEFDTQGDVVDLSEKVVHQAKSVDSANPENVLDHIGAADNQLAHMNAEGTRVKPPGMEEPLPGFTRSANVEIANSLNSWFNYSRKQLRTALNRAVDEGAIVWKTSPLGGPATHQVIIKNGRGAHIFTIRGGRFK